MSMVLPPKGGHFAEQRWPLGLIQASVIVELYVPAKGTWTMIVTNKDKQTCVISTSHSWHEIPQTVRLGPETALRPPVSK